MLNKIVNLLRLNESVNNYRKIENGLKKLINKTWTIICLGTLFITGLIVFFAMYTSLEMKAVYIGMPVLLLWFFGGIIYYAILRDIMAGCKDGAHATMIIPALKILFLIVILAGAFGLNIIVGIIVTMLTVFYWYKKIKLWIKEDSDNSESNNNIKQ